MPKEKEKPKHPYKVMIGDKIRVFRKDYNGRTFYNVAITQNNYDGTKSTYYRPLTFKKGVEVRNETDIIIRDMFENLRANKKDPYNPITALIITEFDTLERQEQIEQEALEDFRSNLQENEFDENQLPF